MNYVKWNSEYGLLDKENEDILVRLVVSPIIPAPLQGRLLDVLGKVIEQEWNKIALANDPARNQ